MARTQEDKTYGTFGKDPVIPGKNAVFGFMKNGGIGTGFFMGGPLPAGMSWFPIEAARPPIRSSKSTSSSTNPTPSLKACVDESDMTAAKQQKLKNCLIFNLFKKSQITNSRFSYPDRHSLLTGSD